MTKTTRILCTLWATTLFVACGTTTMEGGTTPQHATSNYPPPKSQCYHYPTPIACVGPSQCLAGQWCDNTGNTGGCCCANNKPATGTTTIISYRDVGCSVSCNALTSVACRQNKDTGLPDPTKPCWVTNTSDPAFPNCATNLAGTGFLNTLGLDASKVPGGPVLYRFCKCTGTCNATLYSQAMYGTPYEGCGTAGRGTNGGKCPALVCPGNILLNCAGAPASENCARIKSSPSRVGALASNAPHPLVSTDGGICTDCCEPCGPDESCDPCTPPPEDSEDISGRY